MFGSEMRTSSTRTILVLAFVFAITRAFAIDASDRYRSPRNPERKIRQSTELIVLHTTEAPARSSLNKLCDRGECHFCVTEEGRVYRIVDRDREAFHAGRSMWNGKEDVDKFSIGIECVGYHDKPMPTVQLAAIRDLVKELKSMYRIPDARVVCHSHVAYGAPNKWQKRRHRGRKRCGMLFAMATVRRMLDLKARPAYDPDTRKGRLSVGDDYLNSVLYGGVDTMRAAYSFAPRTSLTAVKSSAQPAAAKPKPVVETPMVAKTVPAKTTPAKPQPSAKPQPPAKPQPSVKPTVVETPPVTNSPPASAVDLPKSVAQLMLGGYVEIGVVTREVSALRLVGAKWNAADTYYVIRGKVTPGSAIDAAHIEKGMSVWRKK